MRNNMQPRPLIPMMKPLVLPLLLLLAALAPPLTAAAQRHDLRGRVVESHGETPVGQAVVELPRLGLWAVADNDGWFEIKGVPAGEQTLACSCLGYVTVELAVSLPAAGPVTVRLVEDNLKLDDVVVTARESSSALSTSRTIGSNALDHLQMVNASDISSLLPGGKTVNPDLTVDTPLTLRDGGTTVGNAAFGTAIEVDGVRLSTNGLLGDLTGASTRNVATTNIEQVEVITGVPSAEYGDIGSGVVKISTRRGRTPWTVLMATNPRTKEISLSKGFDLGRDRGVLNAAAEYARATKNPVSPYTSYSRSGLSLTYSGTFARVLRLTAGVTGNIGGMNTEDDPDAYSGAFSRERDNALRGNVALQWLLNRSWITDVEFDASVNYTDNRLRNRSYETSSTSLPAVHSQEEGYYFAAMLPATYYTTQIVDSKQLDYAASLKAKWIRPWSGGGLSNLKAGLAWRAEGNIGAGEYYEVPELAPDRYRPYPYTNIPYLHNLAYWLEETLTLPVGSTSLTVMAGLRGESTFIKNSRYNHTSTWSPRLNARWQLTPWLTVRGGWGLVEKLPSLGVLYPRPRYTDVRMYSLSGAENLPYVYYTHPYEMAYNEALRWQRNRNAEVGLDLTFGGTRIALAGYWNRTRFPFEDTEEYTPISFNHYAQPDADAFPSNPMLKVDSQTGEIFVRDADNMESGWQAMPLDYVNRTFTSVISPGNGSPIDRAGVELTAEFPMINAIRTELRLDAAYAYTRYVRGGTTWYYPSGSNTSSDGADASPFYQYVGIYADVGNTTSNGEKRHALDMNLTATVHIPRIRMIVTLRLEGSLVSRWQALSLYDGREYAYNVGGESNAPAGGSIYDGNSYTAVRPLYYMDVDGIVHPFTDREAADPAFARLIRRSTTTGHFAPDGYDPYFSANLSITKEIGNIASISFYANNFTNSRRYVSRYATGVREIRTPGFYYGLTLRLKF